MLKKILNINKKWLIVVLSILVIVISVFCLVKISPKKLENILASNAYKKEAEYKTGSKMGEITLSRNAIKYANDEISIMIYEFNDIEEIKKEGTLIYNKYKDNIGFTTKFVDERKYIYIRACDTQQCFYTLGYDNELVQSIVNIKLKKETDEIFNSIIKEKKLD